MRAIKSLFSKNLLQILQYGLCGIITTLINLLLFYVFSENGMYYLNANGISYYIAVVINFFMNYFLVFSKKKENISIVLKKMWNFLILRTVSLLFDSMVFFLLVTGLGFEKYLTRVLLSSFIIVINYFWGKRKIFL